MHRIRIAGALIGAIAATALAAAPALADKTYTIRVEGQTRTLLAKRAVTVPDNGQIPGANTGCTYDKPSGPLDAATAGDWDRALSPPSSFAGLVETVLGERHTAADTTSWALWVNGRWGGGICFQTLSDGDDILVVGGRYDSNFNAVDLPLSISGAPAHAIKDQPFTVTVREPRPDLGSFSDFVSGTGTPQPAVGATVAIGGAVATTGTDGTATLTPTETGALTLQATRGGAPSRSETHAVCVSAGNDGTCGTSKPLPPPDRAAPLLAFAGLANGRTYARGTGPRELRGTATDASGVLMVKLRITRTVGGRCSYFSGRRLAFRPMRCGAENGSWFRVGSDANWRFLLPQRLAAGRYVIDVNAIDRSHNRDDARRRGVNRAVVAVR